MAISPQQQLQASSKHNIAIANEAASTIPKHLLPPGLTLKTNTCHTL
jgi:hypothetical protein